MRILLTALLLAIGFVSGWVVRPMVEIPNKPTISSNLAPPETSPIVESAPISPTQLVPIAPKPEPIAESTIESAELSVAEQSLKAIEGRLSLPQPDPLPSDFEEFPEARFEEAPTVMEKEDNVRVGVTFKVDPGEGVKVEKNAFEGVLKPFRKKETENEPKPKVPTSPIWDEKSP